MKNEEELLKIVFAIYREMYSKSIPKADFDELMKSGKTKEREWFYAYHLSLDKQSEIVERHCFFHKLSKRQAHEVSKAIFLGSSPCSCEGKNPDHKIVDLK